MTRMSTALNNGAPNRSQVGMWAVVGGGGTMKIHSHYNVSALTDNGTGDFTLTFVVPFGGASEYAIVSAQTSGNFITSHVDHTNAPTAGACRIVTVNNTASGFIDRDPVSVMAVGRR